MQRREWMLRSSDSERVPQGIEEEMTAGGWNYDRTILAPGKLRSVFATKWKNHLAGDEWRPIVPIFANVGGIFSMTEAPYEAHCPLRADGEFRFESTNQYDIWTKQIRRDPAKGITK